VQSGEDVDLRPYGLHLLKHYVWVKGYTGFFAQTSDGIIINTKGSLRIGGIKDGRLQSINYKNQNEFDADAEFIRQMVYSYNGTVNRVRESLGIRTILYKLTLNGMNIDITVSIHIDDPQKNGYGWIDMDIKK
jgi:hypothetical protein